MKICCSIMKIALASNQVMKSEKWNSEQYQEPPPRQVQETSLFAAVELEVQNINGGEVKPLLISAIVPNSWLLDDQRKVRWPAHMPSDMVCNYVIERVIPQEHWDYCRVIKCIVLDSCNVSAIIQDKGERKSLDGYKPEKTVPPVLLQRAASDNDSYEVKPSSPSAKRMRHSSPPPQIKEEGPSSADQLDYETFLLHQAKFAVMKLVKQEFEEVEETKFPVKQEQVNGGALPQPNEVVAKEKAMAVVQQTTRQVTVNDHSLPVPANVQWQQTSNQQLTGPSSSVDPDFQSLIDSSLQETPSVDSYMAMSFQDQKACLYSLLKKTTLLNAKIYNVLLEIQAKLVSMGVAPMATEAPLEAASIHEQTCIYQSWVKKLPLREVHEYLDFNDMLLDHPSVGNDIATFVIMMTNARPSLSQQINQLLPNIIGKTLAVHLNHKGGANKVGFFNTPFLQLLIKCVRGYEPWKEASEEVVTKCVKVWLSNAPLRLKNQRSAR